MPPSPASCPSCVDDLVSRRLIAQLPGHAPDMSAATFVVNEEDHTLGNALRYVLMKESVDSPALSRGLTSAQSQGRVLRLLGSSPVRGQDPSANSDVRCVLIALYAFAEPADGDNALQALLRALDNLKDLTQSILEKYETDLARQAYSTESDEPVVDWDDINARAEASRQKKREEREAAKKAAFSGSSSRNVGR